MNADHQILGIALPYKASTDGIPDLFINKIVLLVKCLETHAIRVCGQAMPHIHHHIMRIVEIDAMLTSQQQFPTRLAFMTNDIHMVRIDGLRHVTFQTCHSRAIGTVPQTRKRKRSIQYRTHAAHTAKRSRMFKRFDKFACRHHRTNSM